MDISYVSDPTPGVGYLPARATQHSTAPRQSLNGQWRFRLHERADDGDDGFQHPDYDDSGWATITVPGHWQLQGYGRPAYTNVSYPFPIDPPHVPDANPTGDYRLAFTATDDLTVLRFDGVDSCFVVWLNGTRLGHATGSRLPTEFDVTGLLATGTNVIAVRVHQWSAGSYLEDQDMWWLSGIFREVTLLSRPSIDDLFVHTDYAPEAQTGNLRVDVIGAACVLNVPGLGIVDANPEDQTFTCAGVRPWSAEDPHLYTGTLTTDDETIRLRIGFRSISTDGGVLTVNGRPITLRGVNRHEFDPDRGRALDVDTARADVLRMKQHNINAVRTSHYPPQPTFLDLCDELGLWVIDECDLETHGFSEVGWRGNPSDDPAWRPAIADRMRRTLERDKNHPSIIMWSLGNEAGIGANLAAASAWVAERDPSRPRHYEGDRASTYVDVYSRMYPSHAEVEQIGSEPGMPFVMCEFAHAMGNGPGGLAAYQAIIDAHPRCAGGFVWEWIDHGLRRPDHSFGYGGDFGEELHDGNFVCDGLLFPDRTPSPGLHEVAAVFGPVRITAGGPGRVRIENRYDVRDLSHLRFEWTVSAPDADLDSGLLAVPPIDPRADEEIPLPDLPALDGEAWLTIRAVLARDEPWAPAGHEVSWGQIVLRPAEPSSPPATRVPPRRSDDRIALGPGVFDARTGGLLRLGDADVAGPIVDLWRAPTDNDIGAKLDVAWRAIGLHRLHQRVVDVDATGDDLVVTLRVGAAATDLGYHCVLLWRSDSDGLALDVTGEPIGDWPCPLPKFGLRFTLPASLDRVDWCGFGPGEAYRDTRAGVRLGRFSRSVDELQTPYVRPQENGNRIDARAVAFTDADGIGVAFAGDPTFDFTARRWTSADLDAAGHTADLSPRDRIYVTIDAAHHGIGSASCGPEPLDRLDPGRFHLRAKLGLVAKPPQGPALAH